MNVFLVAISKRLEDSSGKSVTQWHQSRRRGQQDVETDTFSASLRIMPERRCNFAAHGPAPEERSKHNTIFIPTTLTYQKGVRGGR